MVTSTLMVAKNSAEHHYHEISGKKKIPSTRDVSVSFMYYLSTVPARKVVIDRFVWALPDFRQQLSWLAL